MIFEAIPHRQIRPVQYICAFTSSRPRPDVHRKRTTVGELTACQDERFSTEHVSSRCNRPANGILSLNLNVKEMAPTESQAVLHTNSLLLSWRFLTSTDIPHEACRQRVNHPREVRETVQAVPINMSSPALGEYSAMKRGPALPYFGGRCGGQESAGCVSSPSSIVCTAV